jgi:asparagine synthetase B (glutamine-hydrolysing)
MINNWPGFWGAFSVAPGEHGAVPEAPLMGDPIWETTHPSLRLHVGRAFTAALNAWHDPRTRGQRPSVFVTGSFYLGDDTVFGMRTRVTSLELSDAPNRIAGLYEEHGPGGFAYLDGEFNIILSDPRTGSIYLVTDKCGSHDIYFREEGGTVLFGSHPLLLSSRDERFDPQATSFYLAHEGFFPSPFTFSPRIHGIGRSRFLRITPGPKRTLETQSRRYWQPSVTEKISSRQEADDTLHHLLQDATQVRSPDKSAILLSGGIDSSVLVNLAASNSQRPVTVTGTVKGWVQGEHEVETSRKLSDLLGLQHHVVVLDPHDDSLPEEYAECAVSWMTGSRLTLPLWRRYAALIREQVGDGYRVVAGQTADTLADNNYTLPSMGYTMRRALFSSWMLKLLPAISAISPQPDGGPARFLSRVLSSLGGARIAPMFGNLLSGLSSREQFYGGRVFGYGETPGLSGAYFPMLTTRGFEAVTQFFSDNFVKPIANRITPETFYRDMIELSLDMNMLHLDSRLLFHVYRLEGASAALPFMDARIVNFFGNIPYSARSILREPKHLVRNQLRRPGMAHVPLPPLPEPKSQEQLLLEGSLGSYLREVVGNLTFLNRAPGLLEFIDQSYLEDQIHGFRVGRPGVNAKLISKLAAIEHWSRAMDRLPREDRGDRLQSMRSPMAVSAV